VRLTSSELTLFIEGCALVGKKTLSPPAIMRNELAASIECEHVRACSTSSESRTSSGCARWRGCKVAARTSDCGGGAQVRSSSARRRITRSTRPSGEHRLSEIWLVDRASCAGRAGCATRFVAAETFPRRYVYRNMTDELERIVHTEATPT
jgi:hypothetical protein